MGRVGGVKRELNENEWCEAEGRKGRGGTLGTLSQRTVGGG